MSHPQLGTKVTNRPTGMWGFTIIWIGQLVSLFGTAMTNFALTIWAWEGSRPLYSKRPCLGLRASSGMSFLTCASSPSI